MFEKRVYLEQHLDHFRKWMLRERVVILPRTATLFFHPRTPPAQAGFVNLEQTEYPPMSGSSTICAATALLEPA
jgi:proline racemase